MTYSYKKDKNIQLSSHFKVSEFRCKDGSDKIIINPSLIVILEQLRDFLDKKYGIKSINITSGYRTPEHSVRVGGYKSDQHTKGNAADFNIKTNKLTKLSAKKICLALEDLGHKGGVGYINSTHVHLDVRGRKVYFDETKGEKTTSSWYKYWNISIPKPDVKIPTYKIVRAVWMNFRATPNGRIIGKAYFNNKVEFISKVGDWTKCKLKGKVGYLYSKYLR